MNILPPLAPPRSKTGEITGYPQHEAEGQLFVERFVEQKLQPSVTEVFDKALRGIQTSNYSLELRTKGRDTRYLLVNATTRRDVDGEITGVVGVAQDVTDYEAEKVRTATQHARAEAERGMNEFLAHEVRNPLSVAVGGLRFVETALGAAATPKVVADLNMARVSTKHTHKYANK